MINPILGIDTWEGQSEIDEAILKANNVAFVFVRLNDMNGGHHLDTGFAKQWAEVKNFYRAPYFVYNPWVTGQANYNWLVANMPADAKAVAIDIEVAYAGYPAATYAAEVAKFEALVKAKWNYVIYTGEWFLSYLSYWNKLADYWWAQYPYDFYPPNNLTLTWDELRTKLLPYTVPSNSARIPGNLKFWQFSGDRLILPGNSKPMDVNIYYGTTSELEAFMGAPAIVIPPPTGEITSTPYRGIRRTTGRAHGWDYALHEIDPTQTITKSIYNAPLRIGSDVGKTTDATVVINGGEWDRIKDTINYTVCNGVLKIYRNTPQPSLMVTDTGKFIIDHKAQTAKIEQALTGLRYLVGNLADPTSWNSEGHNRTCYGLSATGQLLILCTEGAYPNQGWTLQQCREFLIAHGAVIAFDAGGGGDVTCWDKNEGLLLQPQNISERYLPNHLLIYAEEINMANGTAQEILGNTSTVRSSPSRYGVSVYSLPPRATTEFVKVVPVVVGGSADNPADQWLQLPDGNFVNYILSSKKYYNILTNPTLPPVDDSIVIDIALYDVKVTGDKYEVKGAKAVKVA